VPSVCMGNYSQRRYITKIRGSMERRSSLKKSRWSIWRMRPQRQHPLPPHFLGDGATIEELLPLLGGCLWLGVSKSRVSPQYIEVKMQCDTHLIQELLNTSRTFLGTPLYPHKSIKTWIGWIHNIWQEFKSITSPSFGIPKLLLYPSVKPDY
jgi:hypothetical protein